MSPSPRSVVSTDTSFQRLSALENDFWPQSQRQLPGDDFRPKARTRSVSPRWHCPNRRAAFDFEWDTMAKETGRLGQRNNSSMALM